MRSKVLTPFIAAFLLFAFSGADVQGNSASGTVKMGYPMVNWVSNLTGVNLSPTWYVPEEITPWIIGNYNGTTSYLFTTAYSVACETNQNILSGMNLSDGECAQVTQGDIYQNPPSFGGIWKRSYLGAFTGHVLNQNSQALPNLVTVNHGENKNTKNAVDWVAADQNSITSSPTVDQCYSGVFDGDYEDCPSAYFAFVTMASTPWSAQSGYAKGSYSDLGPIIWPATGYLNPDGTKAGLVMAPSSIVWNGYLYVYYLELSMSGESGRTPGVKVARAPIRADNTVRPEDFRNYYAPGDASTGSFSEPSLPAGFTPQNAASFTRVKGGRSSDITGTPFATFHRFSVARLKGTSTFVAVALEEGKITLRLSKDLVSWGPATVVRNVSITDGEWWDKAPLLYPVLVSADGTTNTEVDPRDFKIMGINANQNSSFYGHANYVSLSISYDEPVGGGVPSEGASESAGTFGSGFFTFQAGIAFSNGTSFCAVQSWGDYLALGGKDDMSNVYTVSGTPQNLRYDGLCTVHTSTGGLSSGSAGTSSAPTASAGSNSAEPSSSGTSSAGTNSSGAISPGTGSSSGVTFGAGFFTYESGIAYSNGSAFCTIQSWSDFISMGGRADMGNVAQVSQRPQNLRNDGPCVPGQ